MNSLRILASSFVPTPNANNFDSRGHPLCSLFAYRDICRHLILGAKVRGDWHCLEYIRGEFRRLLLDRAEFSRVDYVAAAPSSLWGRLRLRINLAQYLVDDFCSIYPAKRLELPLAASLSLRKRARSHSKRWIVDEIKAPAKVKWHKYQDVKAKRVLIIDDIVTSGLTLSSIGVQFSESDVQFLTFASAYGRQECYAVQDFEGPNDSSEQ
jgi:predicted amidophosphoribosyltransferase